MWKGECEGEYVLIVTGRDGTDSWRDRLYLSKSDEIGTEAKLDEIGTEAKLDEIEGQKWKSVLRYTDFLLVRSRENQKVRVPEYTFSLFPINLVQFGFCTNLVRFRFFSLHKLVERTDGRYLDTHR